MVNCPGLPGSPFRTATLAPFGSEGGAAPHLMSSLFMTIESAPKAGAAMQSAAAIRVFLMVPPFVDRSVGRTEMVDLTSRPELSASLREVLPREHGALGLVVHLGLKGVTVLEGN